MKLTEFQRLFVDKSVDNVDKDYKKSLKELQEVYNNYSKDQEKLLNELSRVLMDYDIKAEYLELSAEEKKKLKNKFQVSINDMILEEYNNDLDQVGNILGSAAKRTYLYQEYLLSIGIDFKLKPLPIETIKKIINKAVTENSGIWSSLIWNNKKKLATILKKAIWGLFDGKESVNSISKKIREAFNVGKYESERLVRTETAKVQQNTINEVAEKHNLNYQLFIATLDGRTSEKCRHYDGKSFSMNDPNKPTIPVHPNCRSVMSNIPDKDYKPDTRKNHITKEIEPYKSYMDWYKENTELVQAQEKIIKEVAKLRASKRKKKR